MPGIATWQLPKRLCHGPWHGGKWRRTGSGWSPSSAASRRLVGCFEEESVGCRGWDGSVHVERAVASMLDEVATVGCGRGGGCGDERCQ